MIIFICDMCHKMVDEITPDIKYQNIDEKTKKPTTRIHSVDLCNDCLKKWESENNEDSED